MAPPSPQPSVTRVALLLGTVVALTVFGSSAVAVALPTLGRDLEIGLAEQAWVLATLTLSFSITTAIFGRLTDLFGLRRPWRVGVAMFAAGALVAAAAPTYPVLLAGRLLQGAGAGAVPVLGVGIIAARFQQEARARALGGLTSVVAVVSGSGPLLGGLLADLVGWRLVLAVPALSLLFLEPVARLAPREGGKGGTFDVPGALLVAVVLLGLVLLLQAPATGGGAPLVVTAATLGVAGTVLAARHIRRRPDGLLPLAVVTNRVLVLGSWAGFTILASYLGLLLAIPQLLSAEFGWSPSRIGLTLVPAAALGAVSSRFVGGNAQRLGRFRVLTVLAAGSTAGLLLAAAAPANPALLVAALALTSAGFAAGQVAMVDGIPDLVAERDRGAAIGLFNLVFFTGGAVGSAATGGLAGPLTLPGALAVLAALPALGTVAALRAGRLARTGRRGSVPPTRSR